jgi:hypothetical protein
MKTSRAIIVSTKSSSYKRKMMSSVMIVNIEGVYLKRKKRLRLRIRYLTLRVLTPRMIRQKSKPNNNAIEGSRN